MREITKEEFPGSSTRVEEIQEKPAEKTKKQGPVGDIDHQDGSVQTEILKEKGFRAWLTRNAVAFCTIFIGVFTIMHSSAWVRIELSEFFIGPIVCLLASLPLILIRTDHWIMRLAGWFGVLSWGFIILLYLVGITPQHTRDGDFFWYLTGVYFLNTVILGVMARKGAVRNRKNLPRWEQRIRGWASRNVVAYSNAFILLLLIGCLSLCYALFNMEHINSSGEDFYLYLYVLSVILSFLVSIPLILSKKGGQNVANAGWLGVFWFPLPLVIRFLIEPDISAAKNINLTVSIYTVYALIAITLAYFGRRKAKKELSKS